MKGVKKEEHVIVVFITMEKNILFDVENLSLFIRNFKQDDIQECKEMEETLKREEEKNNCKVVKIDCNTCDQGFIKHFQIKEVPTAVMFKNGKYISTIKGFDPKQLVEQLSHFNKPLTEILVDNSEIEATDIDTRIKNMINSNHIMLFMKGEREKPFCKFSKRIIPLLDTYTKNYSTFDVFSDDQIRERLKVLSNWPTYPQLFVDGELIGGIDIVQQLHDENSLRDVLKLDA